MEAKLQNFKSHNILCVKAELRDLKPKLLCGSGTAERPVAVYFLCGSGTTGLPSIITCAEAECQTLNSHNILCAEAELLFMLEFYGPVNNEVMSSRSVNSGTVPGQV